MDHITINPKRCIVNGNIIGNQIGYLESLNGFQSHKSEVSINSIINDGYEGFDIYSFKIKKNQNIRNAFVDEIAYCKSTSVNSLDSYLFVCEHFQDGFNPYHDVMDINPFDFGYCLTVKDEYLADNRDDAAPFYLLILQGGVGVEIPSDASSILYSCNFEAPSHMENIQVGFVYFDKNKKLLSNTIISNIADTDKGNIGRCKVVTNNIPADAKYVGVEFYFPDGVDRHLIDGIYENDYFSIELNCLLFNQKYGGFIKNG